MLTVNKKIGERIEVLYPTHGRMNTLRNVKGVIEKTGNGPNGPNVTIVEDNGNVRCLSEKKIVSW